LGVELQHVTVELDWRRREMESATASARTVRARFLAGPLASQLRAWGQPPEDVVVSMTALAEVSSRTEFSDDGETAEARPIGDAKSPAASDQAPGTKHSAGNAADPERTDDPAAPLPAKRPSGGAPVGETVDELETTESRTDGEVKS
ncbi:MAG: hypothetical protein AAGG01_18865, partial [Planctomycetota bacterium]